MDEIGVLLKEARESSGVSLKEACNDINTKELVLENIEDGKIGSFKDVFELKTIIFDYAKYLGLDADKIIDSFNEYMFEYTSKIPIKEIEKTIELQLKEEKKDENKVVSPYTKTEKKSDSKYYIFMFILIVLLIILVVTWAIRQVALDNYANSTTIISYNG